MKNAPKGFAVLELILIIIVLGIIAFVAWRVIDASGAVDQAASSVSQTTVVPNSDKASVTPTSNKDLDTLGKQLDNTSVDDSSSSELDTESTF